MSPVRRSRSSVLRWLATVALVWVWSAAPSQALAAKRAFRDVRLDILHLSAPVELAPTEDGGVVAVYRTGEAVHYDPQGARRELVLPVHPWRRVLHDLPRSEPNLFFQIAAKPHYRPSSPFTAALEAMPDVIAWDQKTLRDGERVRPWLMRVRLRSRDWYPRKPVHGGREPVTKDKGFSLRGCTGGSLVVGDGETLFVQHKRGQSWRRTRGELPVGARPAACQDDGSGGLIITVKDWHKNVSTLRLDAQGRLRRAEPFDAGRLFTVVEIDGIEGRGCQANDGAGTTVEYGWTDQSDVLSLHTRNRWGRWEPLVHVTGDARVACQVGGRGAFVASERGLDFFEPVRRGITAPNTTRRQPDGRFDRLPEARPTYRARGVGSSLIPNRVQIISTFTSVYRVDNRFQLQATTLVAETEGIQARGGAAVELSVQWEFGAGLKPRPRRSEAVRRLKDMPARIQLAAHVTAPVLPPTGAGFRGQAQAAVYSALKRSLAAAPH